jgi:glycosyltransferase involved in cell wall biosynthesis
VAASEAAAVHPRSLGIPTTVVPNGVLVPETPAEPPDPSATPIVGITAAITPWKGHRVFLRAVAAVPGVEAEVMGGAFPKDQGYERELHELAADLGIADRVRFLGHVAEPAPVLRRWQVAVSASTDPEAGPLSVLEAMAHGIPVVASDHGGAQEILRGNDAGILVPVNDPDALAAAVRDVLADDERRRRMGVAGRSTVLARHRADQAAAAFLAVLGEAAADPPRPGRGR